MSEAPERTTAVPSGGSSAGPSAAVAGLGRGSSANLIGSAVMAMTTFVLTVAVTRGLSREAAGLFFSATSIFILATNLGQLGTNTALVYFLARSRSLGATQRIPHYLRAAVRPVIITAVLAATGLLIWAEPVAALVTPGHVDVTAGYLRILALFIPLAGIENVLLAASRGLGVMRPSVIVEQVGRSLVQVLLVGSAIWLSDDRYLGLAWAVPYLPAAIWAVLWWRSLSRRVATELSVEDPRALVREFWRFSGPRALASVGQVTMQRLDIILVAAIAGPISAAIYTAATRFVVVGQMANRAISNAVQPRLSQSLARNDVVETNHLYRISTAWLMVLTWPLYLSLMIYGERLLGVFGKGYDAGSGVLLLLAASMLVATACGMVDMVLNMGGRTMWNLANVTLALAVNLGLDLWLIPSHGILGAAIGWAAAIALSNLAALTQVGLILRLHPFGRSTLLAGGLPLACFAALPLVVQAVLGHATPDLVVGLVLSVLTYGWGLWWVRRTLELKALVATRRPKRRAGAAT